MSKLKAIHAFDVYEEYTKTGDDEAAQVYLKSEVDKEIRRLNRALYKALANWAHEAKFVYDDEFSRWDEMEQKCLIKVEEYK